MTRIQFGWSLPSGPLEGMSRNAYMEGVQKGILTHSGLLTIYNRNVSCWFAASDQAEKNRSVKNVV